MINSKVVKNNTFKNIVKLGFVGGLLYFLADRGFLSMAELKNAFKNWPHIVVAYALFLATTLIGILRWQWLLEGVGISLSLKRTLQLGFVGNFFNIALPGAVSGDVVKAIYVAREAPGKRAHSLSSILFDRVTGLSALIMFAAGALLLSLNASWGHNLFKALAVFVVVSAAAVIAFFAYLFSVKEHHDPLLRLFRWAETKVASFGSFTRIYEGFRLYRTERRTVFASLGLSFFIHFLVVLAFYELTLAFEITDLPLLGLYVIVPLGLLITAIPIFPAGVGTGHAAFVAFYHLLGCERGADIFNLMLLYKVSEGAFGGLVYLKFKSVLKLDVSPGSESETDTAAVVK